MAKGGVVSVAVSLIVAVASLPGLAIQRMYRIGRLPKDTCGLLVQAELDVKRGDIGLNYVTCHAIGGIIGDLSRRSTSDCRPTMAWGKFGMFRAIE